jgi:hypothetical protein
MSTGTSENKARRKSPRPEPPEGCLAEWEDGTQLRKLDPAKVKAGDLMVLKYPVKVRTIGKQYAPYGALEATVEHLEGPNKGKTFQVAGESLFVAGESADQVVAEEKVSMTRAAQVLVHSRGMLFTVAFTKKDGSERTLRGKLIATEHLLGRSTVADLDQPEDDQVRQVDHRTILWIVFGGIKYIVK